MRKLRNWEALERRFVKRSVCSLDLGGSDAPKPDPGIGQAALINAQTGKEMVQLGREQLASEKERAARQDPLYEKLIGIETQSAQNNQDRASQQWKQYEDFFMGNEQKLAQEVDAFSSPERTAARMEEAKADVSRAYDTAGMSSRRDAERRGVRPDSGVQAGLDTALDVGRASDTAAAATRSVNSSEMTGMALRENVAKFGRNLPSTGIATDAASISSAGAATGTMGAQTATRVAGLNSALPWMSGGVAANTAGGNLLVGLTDAQMKGYQAEQTEKAGQWGGLGMAAGAVAAAFI